MIGFLKIGRSSSAGSVKICECIEQSHQAFFWNFTYNMQQAPTILLLYLQTSFHQFSFCSGRQFLWIGSKEELRVRLIFGQTLLSERFFAYASYLFTSLLMVLLLSTTAVKRWGPKGRVCLHTQPPWYQNLTLYYKACCHIISRSVISDYLHSPTISTSHSRLFSWLVINLVTRSAILPSRVLPINTSAFSLCAAIIPCFLQQKESNVNSAKSWISVFMAICDLYK